MCKMTVKPLQLHSNSGKPTVVPKKIQKRTLNNDHDDYICFYNKRHETKTKFLVTGVYAPLLPWNVLKDLELQRSPT